VFQNRELRRILAANRDEIRGDWRQFHYKKIHSLYSSPNTPFITGSKSKRMILAGYVAWIVG
jgi:hypothetical protein